MGEEAGGRRRLDEAGRRRLVRLHHDSRALIDVFADRLTEQQLDSARSASNAGEWSELVDVLCAILVRRRIPVTPAERDAVAGVLAQFVQPMPDHRFLGDPEGALAALHTVDVGAAP